MESKLPTVFFSYTAFLRVVLEMQKFYRKGLAIDKRPWEATAFPLALLKTRLNKTPFEMLNLDDIESVVISNVFSPDDEFKNYSSSRANFLPGINENMEKKISPFLIKYPRLDFCCKLHSHPHGAKFLSRKDKDTILRALKSQQETGINSVFSFIMTTQKDSWQDIKSWQIHAYALNQGKVNVALPIEIIHQSDSLIKEALNLPFYKINRNYLWLKDFLDFASDNQDCKVEVCELYRGWISGCLRFSDHEIHICFPPDFPNVDGIKIIYFGKNTRVLDQVELVNLINNSYRDKRFNKEILDKILTLNKTVSNEKK